jgi:hypothetical protein
VETPTGPTAPSAAFMFPITIIMEQLQMGKNYKYMVDSYVKS